MIITKQDRPGGYIVTQYCDLCPNEIKLGVRVYHGYNKCKICGKTICVDCRYWWNFIESKIDRGGVGYFDTIYCYEDMIKLKREDIDK